MYNIYIHVLRVVSMFCFTLSKEKTHSNSIAKMIAQRVMHLTSGAERTYGTCTRPIQASGCKINCWKDSTYSNRQPCCRHYRAADSV